ncbi:ragulator complex protein LAMTOR5 homolog [Centruroides vittatus]|uniref:ragulator complex protein LAMTOR5 homolog n=1 Tax=Centruroides vittatus TaxID=120091 RepID=UPI0035104EF6
MEKQLEKCVDEICAMPSVNGILCADNQGLCMAYKGIAAPKSAGVFTFLTKLASSLEPNNKPPVIQLDGKKTQILIKNTENITMAIYKSSQ